MHLCTCSNKGIKKCIVISRNSLAGNVITLLVCLHACVHACVRACVHAYVCACARACTASCQDVVLETPAVTDIELVWSILPSVWWLCEAEIKMKAELKDGCGLIKRQLEG